jgi:hypothetical protein
VPKAEALRDALRALLLPIDPAREREAEKGVASYLTAAGVGADDHTAVVRLELRRWRDDGAPSALLREAVAAALASGDPVRGDMIAARYFELHATLMADFLLSFEEARGLLSHLRLALHLIEHEQMSCAQVARVIEARRRDSAHTWQQVYEMCRSFGTMPVLDLDKVKALTDTDKADEVERFADANDVDAIALIAEVGADLGFPGDLHETLRSFMSPDPLGGFLIILHFEAAVAEYYDHPLSATYELSPRGQVALFLQAEHPSYTAAENAFLNLAKGASAFDAAWVWGRNRQNRSRASALVRLLGGLESMGFSARRELAAWLRQWLIRIERRSDPRATLGGITSLAQITNLVSSVAVENSRTHGVLEQRVVDALSEVIHPSAAGWYPRGLGDSVNASNLRRRKTGDCEFEHSAHHSVAAYEAHGGRLAEVYVEGHRRSLAAVLRARTDDLAAVAPVDEWDITITFIAHDIGGLVDRMDVIEEFDVKFEFIDYSDLFERARDALAARGEPESTLLGHANARIVGPLNEPWTPQEVLERAADFGGLTLVPPP